MNETEHKTNYIQIQNLIGQLRMQIKLLSDDEDLVKKAIEKLKELEGLFITEEK